MKQTTILVVDNNSSVRDTMSSLLSVLGIKSVECESGQEALASVRTSSFDGIISDVVMPEMSGFELTTTLKQQAPGLPVILMSSYASTELEKEAKSVGAVGLMSKPFKVNTVAQLLSAAKIEFISPS